MASTWWHELLFLLQRLTWSAVLDILLVTLVLYVTLTWLQQTQGMAILRGVLVLIVFGGVLLSLVNLPTLRWLTRTLMASFLFALPVIFAPEIRQALERLGRLGALPMWIRYYDSQRLLAAVTEAAEQMSQQRIGALIVIERHTALGEYAATGVLLDAMISPELLVQIFWPNTPLHDGAVLIRRGRLYAAACILPLPEGSLAPEERLGLRHRAAIGITQRTDALAIVISEETGTISVALNGSLTRNLDRERLTRMLETHLVASGGFEFPFLRYRRSLLRSKRP